MGEVSIAAAKAGWEPSDFHKLSKDENLMRRILGVLYGTHEIQTKDVIDLDADPRIPNEGWTVEEHKKGGQFTWDASKVQLFLHSKQQGGSIEGNKLRKELADKPVYNANLLDYLLENPHLIPKEWEGKTVVFWGTIYRDSLGRLFVKYLIWGGGPWSQDLCWLDYEFFDASYPSTVATN